MQHAYSVFIAEKSMAAVMQGSLGTKLITMVLVMVQQCNIELRISHDRPLLAKEECTHFKVAARAAA